MIVFIIRSSAVKFWLKKGLVLRFWQMQQVLFQQTLRPGFGLLLSTHSTWATMADTELCDACAMCPIVSTATKPYFFLPEGSRCCQKHKTLGNSKNKNWCTVVTPVDTFLYPFLRLPTPLHSHGSHMLHNFCLYENTFFSHPIMIMKTSGLRCTVFYSDT